MDNVTTIENIADVMRDYVYYNNVLLNKYHILLDYTLSTETKESHEDSLSEVKKHIPDVQIIPIENRDRIPQDIFQDEDMDGFSQLLDNLETVLALEKKDKVYFILIKRADMLVFLYDQIRNLAKARNTKAIQALLDIKDSIYTADATTLNTIGDTINLKANEIDSGFSSWTHTKQKIYVIAGVLEQFIWMYDCKTTKDVMDKVSELAKDPESAEAKQFEKAFGIPPSPEYIEGLLSSDECPKSMHLRQYFWDIRGLANMGEGKAIQYMLDEEEKLYTLSVDELSDFMYNLEKSIGLR